MRNKALAEATATFLELVDKFGGARAALTAARQKLRGPVPPLKAVPDMANERGSWTFAAIGDYGYRSPQSAQVAANLLKAKPRFILTTGDNVYATGREIDYVRNWDPQWGPVIKKIPMYPSVGNHDLYRDDLTAYFKRFNKIDNRSFYTFKDKNAQFFSVNTDEALTAGSPQHAWLDKELAASKSPWKIVYFHYPAYGSGTGFKDVRENLQPLLAKHGVQLALAGHEHSYSRSNVIDGVTHIVTGGGGQQANVAKEKLLPWQKFAAATYHHLEVAVGPTKLTVRALDHLGKLFDVAQIPLKAGIVDASAGAAALAA
jgi:hypothetical protein